MSSSLPQQQIQLSEPEISLWIFPDKHGTLTVMSQRQDRPSASGPLFIDQ
jgi:hypothetical protein